MAAFNFTGDFTSGLQWDFTFDLVVDEYALLDSRPASEITWDDYNAYVAAERNEPQHSAPSTHPSPDTWARLRLFPELDQAEEGTSVCPSDMEGRSGRYSLFGDIPVPESDEEEAQVGDLGEVYGDLEDDDERPIQLLDREGDVAEPRRSPASPDSGLASTSGTEGANSLSLTSTSVGGDHSAGGTILNNKSHDSVDAESRDKITKNRSTAKGKEVAPPRKPARKASKAGGTKKQFQKDSKGYANPIEILRHLYQAGGGLKTTSFDEDFFPKDQAVKVDGKGKYKCGIQGWVLAEGVAEWIETDSGACEKTLSSQDLYRRHVLEVHFGVPRLQKHSQRQRVLKRIEEHDRAGSSGRKRKTDVDEDYEDGEQRARKRLRTRASSSE